MRRKIVLPFMLLFLAGFGALIGVALWESARSVEDRVRAEVRSLAGILAPQPDLLLSQQTLDRVARALRADAVIYGARPGDSSTVPVLSMTTGAPSRIQYSLIDMYAFERPGQLLSPTNLELVSHASISYRVTSVPLRLERESEPELRLYVFYRDDTLASEKLTAMKPLLAVSALGLVIVLLVGARIARNLAAPLEALATRTEALARGDLEHKVEVTSHDEIGRLAQSFNSMLDQLKRVQDERVRAEKLAALGQVTAGIAHEIRNPLTAMKMTLQILLEGEPPGDRRESLSVVLKETERLQLAIDGLLAFAKPPALALAPADLNEVVLGALGVLDAQMRHIGIVVEQRLGALPPVPLDAQRIHQVVVNLLLNAVQAAGAAGRITVATDASGAEVRLSVTDSGPGISAESRPRIFEPFYSTKTGGIGLGLAVSKRLVEDHGGRIAFETAPGRTTFTVALPTAAFVTPR